MPKRLRVAGSSYSRDKTGIVRMVVPYHTNSEEDLDTWVPEHAPYGLPLVGRDAEETVVGNWLLKLTYEGLGPNGGGDVSFGSPDLIEVNLTPSNAHDPITWNPWIQDIKAKYGWTTNGEFPETYQRPLGGDESAYKGVDSVTEANPAYGLDTYLNAGATFSIRITKFDLPDSIMDGVATIFAIPPGWNLLRVPRPKGRNWLKTMPDIKANSNSATATLEFAMSGPKGWFRPAYRSAQIIT